MSRQGRAASRQGRALRTGRAQVLAPLGLAPLGLALLGMALLGGCDDGDGGNAAPAPDAAAADASGRLFDAAPPDAGCVPQAERCDGVDDDCDGAIDEDFGDLGAVCGLGSGPCATQGQWRCDPAGAALICDAPPPREPAAELCNGLDDDCDGAADEGIDFARDVDHCGRCGAACVFAQAEPACDQGVCVVAACLPGFGDANGIAADGCECPLAGEERCNGVDDDCDGAVDEGFALGVACRRGDGLCTTGGLLVCGDDGGLTCDAEEPLPQAEVCNGLDDDCDGVVDEDFDADGDGYPRCPVAPEAPPGALPAGCGPGEACPAGFDCAVLCARQDCDDDDPLRSPGARDVCEDGVDQNCDGHDAPCSQLASRATTMVIVPAETTPIHCADFTGDGIPDNAFAKLAPIANPLLVDAVAQGALNLLPTVAGALPALADGRIDLAILLGNRLDFQSYSVRPESYGDDGEPLMSFPNARMVGGRFSAGPGNFVLGLPVPGGMPGDLRLGNARLSGQLVLAGISARIEAGLIVGVVTEPDLARALETVPANLLPLIETLLVPDLDLDGDGVNDAYSACVTYTAQPIRLVEGF